MTRAADRAQSAQFMGTMPENEGHMTKLFPCAAPSFEFKIHARRRFRGDEGTEAETRPRR
jgi:hypothetical protein